jgi:hypothetical protein
MIGAIACKMGRRLILRILVCLSVFCFVLHRSRIIFISSGIFISGIIYTGPSLPPRHASLNSFSHRGMMYESRVSSRSHQGLIEVSSN